MVAGPTAYPSEAIASSIGASPSRTSKSLRDRVRGVQSDGEHGGDVLARDLPPADVVADPDAPVPGSSVRNVGRTIV